MIKVLTYNIHKGLNWTNQKLVLDKIKEIIIENHADIVFLQEVVGENEGFQRQFLDHPKVSQYEYLADSIWSDFAYAKNAVYENRHHGNVILSKFPIEIQETNNISTNSLEKRGVLYCKIAIPNTSFKLHVFCVHLNLLHMGRKKQYKMIHELISSRCKETDHIILAGDFNDWSMKANSCLEIDFVDAYKFIHGRYAKTFPASFPLLSLDRIYTKNLTILESATLKREVLSQLSDHIPITANLDVL